MGAKNYNVVIIGSRNKRLNNIALANRRIDRKFWVFFGNESTNISDEALCKKPEDAK